MISRSVLQGCISMLIVISADSASITKYDQSQHGTYNVQIHLKNLEVIAILDDSMLSGGDSQNDIYDYDYTDVSAAFANSTTTTTSTTPSSTSSSSYPTSSSSSSSSYPTSSSSSSSSYISSSSSSSSSKPSVTPLASTTTSSTTSAYSGSTTTTANKTTNNRLTTIINAKATPRPSPGSASKTNATAAAGAGKPGSSTGTSSNKYNATNALNVVLPASQVTAATKPPHSKIPEINEPHAKASTPQPATTAGTTVVTPPPDGIDYTLMDTISVPVEVHQPPAASLPAMMNRKCAPGYFRDSNGKCRRIRKPHLPFLQMVHTPGVIKSFQGAESSTKKMTMMHPAESAHTKIPKDERLVLDLAAKMAKEDLSNVKIRE